MPEAIERFHIRVDDSILDDLRLRLARTRFPDQIEGTGWEYGTPIDYLRELVEYWRDEYDWRAQEARLNELEHFRTAIDGQSIHFVHARSGHADAFPLLLIHGWPGSVVEFLDVIPRLTDPEAHGGRADDAFHVIAPSLPGYGFSEPPRTPGWDVRRIAHAFVELMRRLGYDALRRAGRRLGRPDRDEDRGARSRALRRASTSTCRSPALPRIRPSSPTRSRPISPRWRASSATKPRTRSCREASRRRSGMALNDSPAGLLSWIVEKFRTWSDCDGDPEHRLHPRPADHQRDALLGDADVHLVGAVVLGDDAQRRAEGAAGVRDVPTGVARYPKEEILRFPRSWVEQRYNVTHWAVMPRGGHFAAMEQPELFVDDLRTFFRTVR